MEQTQIIQRSHRCCFMLIVTVYVLLILSGCKKSTGGSELNFSGTISDDITGVGISGGGTIRVDGYNGNAVGLFASEKRLNIGNGKINADGSFNVSFTKWDYATSYEFYFYYPNDAYINNGSVYLNIMLVNSSHFSNRSFSMNITAARMTELKIDFRNVSPFNSDDSLHISFPQPINNVLFGYLKPSWENLQNCSLGFLGAITGGINASGALRCNVPADRGFRFDWLTKKNGIIRTYNDSISCARNITTGYTLNY